MAITHSAGICRNVNRKGDRKGVYTYKHGFVSSVSSLGESLLCQVKERAQQRRKGEPGTKTVSKISNRPAGLEPRHVESEW